MGGCGCLVRNTEDGAASVGVGDGAGFEADKLALASGHALQLCEPYPCEVEKRLGADKNAVSPAYENGKDAAGVLRTGQSTKSILR